MKNYIIVNFALLLLIGNSAFSQEEEASIPELENIQEFRKDRPGDFIELSAVNYSTLESVQKNGKIEMGILVPGYIRQQVASFINREKTSNRLNPFDPEDLDITVLFMHTNEDNLVDTTKAYGFYYQEYRRNGDLKGWGKIRDVVIQSFVYGLHHNKKANGHVKQ